MSQFDFPRINFHGTAYLDTATANNGNYEPTLTMFDQDSSEVFLPPRIYIPQGCTCQPPQGVPIKTDKDGNQYVPILPINEDNYQQWATTPLGSCSADSAFLPFYQCITNFVNANPGSGVPVLGVLPGYWNYFGDLSMRLQNVVVTGITVIGINGLPVTYTPENLSECPEDIVGLMGAELSFKHMYFEPDSRTTAYLSDVDSMGQMCTQIFCGTAGLYKKSNGEHATFFKGSPSKSTARFMNLMRTINQTALVPMGGSATFYSAIEIGASSLFSSMLSAYATQLIDAVFMKILVHEVYEVRHPDYSQMPVEYVTNIFTGEKVPVRKNPAVVTITGSITPWNNLTDMKTISISRMLKNATPNTGPINFTLNTSNIYAPPVIGGNGATLPMFSQVNLAPVPFVINTAANYISLDLSNMLHEYGTRSAAAPPYAGNGDIAPLQNFVNYNYGNFSVMFQPDAGGSPTNMGTITYDDYNMQQFIATAGMVDLSIPAGTYINGFFYLSVNGTAVLIEDNYFITTDQNGIYSEQSNLPIQLYLSDGLPLVYCSIRVFFRGVPVSKPNTYSVTAQAINMVTGAVVSTSTVQLYDGMPYKFPVNEDGCLTYVFGDDPSELFPPQNLPAMQGIALFAMNAQMVILRVLSLEPQLIPYIDKRLRITWEVVYAYVLSLYKTLYPIMDVVLPIERKVWSDPFIQRKMLSLIDLQNWNQPLYMPVTRDLSGAQRKLLQMWTQQTVDDANQQHSNPTSNS